MLLDIVEAAEAARVIVAEERDGRRPLLVRARADPPDAARQLVGAAPPTPAPRGRRRDRAYRPGRPRHRPSEIAHHLLQAGAAADTERTLDYLESTADRAMESAAFEEALKSIDDALTVVDEADSARRVQLLEKKGWAVRALGRFEECIEIWDEVVDIYARLGETEAAGKLLWEMGYQLLWLTRFPDAYARYAQGMSVVGDAPSSIRAELIGAAAALTGLAGVFDQAESGFVEALEIAEQLGDERALGRLNWGRCVSYWSHMRTPEAIEAGRRAIEHLERAGDIWTLVDALDWLAYPLATMGEPAEALELGKRAIELGAKLGHQGGEILGWRATIIGQVLLGIDMDEALKLAFYELQRMQAIDSPWVSQSHDWVASFLTLRGELDEAFEHTETSAAMEPASAWTGFGLSARIINRAYAGDIDACRGIVEEHIESFRDPEALSSGRCFLLHSSVEAMAMLGLADEVAQLYPVLLALAERLPVRPLDGASTDRVLGMAAAVLQRWDDAEKHFEAALETAASYPGRFDAPITWHRFAEALIRRDRAEDATRADDLLKRAIAAYEERGMPILLAQAEELLSRASV